MKPQLILHPISFSPSGKSALATAVALARESHAELHVLELRGRASSENPVVRPIDDAKVEPHFDEFVRSVYRGDVPISAVELGGDVVSALVEYAKRTSADLAVVAAHARPHGPYWRPGAYAIDLTRSVPCPTLVVPALAGSAVFANILVAVDMSAAAIEAVKRALNVTGHGRASITFLYFEDGGGAQRGVPAERKTRAEQVARTIREAPPAQLLDKVETHTMAVAGVVDRAIADAARQLDSDLIVIVQPRRDGVKHMDMRSTAASVISRAPCPVLVVPTSAEPIRLPQPTIGSTFQPVLSR